MQIDRQHLNREPTTIRVERDGARDLTFKGWNLGEGQTGSGGEYRKDWTRGTTVDIYLTTGGNLVAAIEQWTRWQGEVDRHRVLGPAKTPEELLVLLIDDADGLLGTASKQAWEAVCQKYPPLAALETETIE